MTDRYTSLTVALEAPIRDDDAEELINAIKMLRGVIAVKGNVTNPGEYSAYERATHDLRGQLIAVLYPKKD